MADFLFNFKDQMVLGIGFSFDSVVRINIGQQSQSIFPQSVGRTRRVFHLLVCGLVFGQWCVCFLHFAFQTSTESRIWWAGGTERKQQIAECYLLFAQVYRLYQCIQEWSHECAKQIIARNKERAQGCTKNSMRRGSWKIALAAAPARMCGKEKLYLR